MAMRVQNLTSWGAVAALAAALATPALGWGAKEGNLRTVFTLELRGAPKGTVCTAIGSQGKVRSGKFLGDPTVTIVRHTHTGDIVCTLPDGHKVITDLNKSAPPGLPDANLISVVIDLRGAGSVMARDKYMELNADLAPGEGYRIVK